MTSIVTISSPEEMYDVSTRFYADSLGLDKPTLYIYFRGPGVEHTHFLFAGFGHAVRDRSAWRAVTNFVCMWCPSNQFYVYFNKSTREFLQIDDKVADAFCVELAARLPAFARIETTDQPVVRKLLGVATEVYRLVTKVAFFYTGGRLKRIVLFFTSALSHPLDNDGPTPVVDAQQQLTVDAHREVVLWYRQQCATQCQVLVSTVFRNAALEWEYASVNERWLLDGWSVMMMSKRERFGDDITGCTSWRRFDLLAGPRATVDEQLHSLIVAPRPTSVASVESVVSPYNHTLDMDAFKDAYARTFTRSARGYCTIRNVPWSTLAHWLPVPHYDRCFYGHFATLVAFVAALSALELPVYVYDELAMWTGVGTLLLERWRIAAIQSTLDTCRRIRAARALGRP